MGDQPGAVVPYVWAPGWNSNQSVFKFQQEVGGPLAGGDPGVRLLDAAGSPPEASRPPAPSEPEPVPAGHFHVARVSDVFGSDELAAASAPIVDRMATPHVLLRPADAEALGVPAGGGVRVEGMAGSFQARLDESVAAGCVGIAAGLPGVPPLAAAVKLTADPDYVVPRAPAAQVIAKG